jgi:hypothetical protein
MRQGLEVHRANGAFKAGNVNVAAGDYIIRGDQPFRTLAEMYFSVQNYPPQNPSPYDDTGWTFQLMRNVKLQTVNDKSIFTQAMTKVTGPVKANGGVEGTGTTLVVEHTADNNLVTFRFKNADVKMTAAEEDFELNGRKLRAGSIIIPNADRAKLEPMLKDLGLSAWAVATAPSVRTHDLDVPRIGYAHSWTRTQDEGWVRAALDTYGIKYTYFADKNLKDEPNLRSKYDVIIYPHVGGTAQSQVNGMAMTGTPLPYRKTDKTPNLGYVDQTDDIRGGMGLEGLMNLAKFVQDGGTLITEGSTTTIFPAYSVTSGVTVENPPQLFVRGSILRGKWSDLKSPLAYGYEGTDVPVYFNQSPVLSAGGGGIPPEFAAFAGGGGAANAGLGQNVTPNAQPLRLSPFDEPPAADAKPQADAAAEFRQMAAQFGIALPQSNARVVMSFPQNPNDMLLSGTLANGQFLSNRAALIDAPLGKGHVVMFAIRPFWRWQTQGTYSMGFNALMNWNDLDAGKSDAKPAGTAGQQ